MVAVKRLKRLQVLIIRDNKLLFMGRGVWYREGDCISPPQEEKLLFFCLNAICLKNTWLNYLMM